MTFLTTLLAAALAVSPMDRLSLADRLFNNGAYKDARTEYEALRGEKSIAADELLYRLAECARQLGDAKTANQLYAQLVKDHPGSRHLDKSLLMKAVTGPEQELVQGLKLLDSDRVSPALRAEALYRLGEATHDTAVLERVLKVDPKGRFAPYARMSLAGLLARSEKFEERRRAVSLLLEIAFGNDPKIAPAALYEAASVSFANKRYGESASLARRYLKNHPQGANAADSRAVAAWSDYLMSKYADALAMCGEGATDDLAYLRGAATQASGDAALAAKHFAHYLEAFPQGRYRKDAERALARHAFAVAEKGTNAVQLVEAAQRCLKFSDSSADHLRLAWAYERAGRAEEARRVYVTVAEKAPGTEDAALAMFSKAMIDLREEKWAAADLALQEALRGKLDAHRKTEAEYWRGVAACRLGHEAEGAELLRAALKGGLSLDTAREARLILADVDYNAGRTNEAIRAYGELVKEGAAERMGAAKTLKVGKVLDAQGRKLCAQSLIKRNSAEWRQAGYALLGAAEAELGNHAAAADAYEHCVAEECKTEVLPRALLEVGCYRRKAGNLAGAEVALSESVKLNAADGNARASAYLALAEVALDRKDAQAARGYLTVIVSLFDKTPVAKQAAEMLGRLEKP